MITKIKNFLAAITGIAAIFYIIKLIKDKPLPDEEEFPQAEEKKAAEVKVGEIKKELEEIEKKEYTDEDIKKKFN
jgi:hypothetical protein